jgi:hypothetical protein
VQSPRMSASAGPQRFYGSAAAGAGSSTVHRTPFVQQQSAVRTAVNGSAAQSSMAAPARGGVNEAAGWQRFEGTSAGRGTPQGNAAPSTRQFQVSPSIIRQRDAAPAASPAAPAQRGGYSPAPATTPAPRSAPAGGGSRSSGSHSNGGGRH